MKKAAEAFRSIGEVSQLVGVAPHVLRYWETQFPLFSPVKRRDGRRYYRPDDIRLAAGLCEILKRDGLSIRDAKKEMAADRGAAVKARGAARLGGVAVAGTDAVGSDLAKPAETAAPVGTPVDKLPAKAAGEAGRKAASQSAHNRAKNEKSPPGIFRKSKSSLMSDSDSLPLFPELGTPVAVGQDNPSGSAVADDGKDLDGRGKAHQIAASEPSGAAWLGRLTTICTDLRSLSAMPLQDSAAILARLDEARRIPGT